MSGSNPQFSVVIPTYARPKQLSACLQALSNLTYPRDSFEVIVIDDGSAESLTAAVKPYKNTLNLIVSRQTNAGPAAARNTGAALARGDYLAFTDDDCAPAPGWLTTLADSIRVTPDAMLGGRTVNTLQQNPYAVTSQLIVDIVYAYYNAEPQQARFFATNNLAVPAKGFSAIGGFDEAFKTAEDRNFCDRWSSADRHMIYVPDAVIYHAHPLTFRSYWRQHFRYGRGAFKFYALRSQRESRGWRIEPAFYLHILLYLFRSPKARRLSTLALLSLWQAANLAGLVWEGIQQRRAHRSTLLR